MPKTCTPQGWGSAAPYGPSKVKAELGTLLPLKSGAAVLCRSLGACWWVLCTGTYGGGRGDPAARAAIWGGGGKGNETQLQLGLRLQTFTYYPNPCIAKVFPLP